MRARCAERASHAIRGGLVSAKTEQQSKTRTKQKPKRKQNREDVRQVMIPLPPQEFDWLDVPKTGSVGYKSGQGQTNHMALKDVRRILNLLDVEMRTEDQVIEDICARTEGVVVAANYNCPGQLVISGEKKAIETACESLKEAGAKRALPLPVGGAFHSPLMEPAKTKLAAAIEATKIVSPICPVYQNVVAKGVTSADEIKANLIAQLTAPVKWTQSVQQLIADGVKSFTEVGPGKVLQGLVKKIDRSAETNSGTID